ncbi:MAG: LEA type 2 family protein [Chitinophagaceae bacterium]
MQLTLRVRESQLEIEKLLPPKDKKVKKKKPFRLSPIFILGILFLASCSEPKPVSFAGYRNIRFSNQGFSMGIIQMDAALYNPNPYPMKIKETTLNVLINHQQFGEIVQDSLSQMPAKDTFLMPVSIKVNLIDFIQKVANLSGSDSILLEANGSCKVGKGGLFFKIPLHYKSKEVLNIF